MNTEATGIAVQMNPFPGLRPFREDEEHLFSGRENQVDEMVDKLASTHFLAVVGTSGSGKSSLVNCGLRPSLHDGMMTSASTAWRMAQFRPGSDPLRAMARSLAENGVLFNDYHAGNVTLTEIIDTTLRMSKLGLIDIYQQAQLDKDINLLVVVDQFEELFRYRQLSVGQDEDSYGVSEEAIAFVNLLLAARDQSTYPIYVVLTMRSDFLGDCAQFPGLVEAINAGQYLVPRMTRDERREAIGMPVSVRGAETAPVLLTRLVNDVGDNPDQLSILQHALNRTWARWQNEGESIGTIDLAHYQAIGTMAHALDQHAEKAYAELQTKRQQQICEKLFKALTDKATDPRGVRRPTTLGTLCALTDATAAEVSEVIDVFRQPSRSFLMPPAGEALELETVIDISHESLMRVWQRLKDWADQEAESARMYRRLNETAALHAEDKASPWSGPDLQLALAWRDQNQPNETWAERYFPGFMTAMAFLDESRKSQEVDLQRELARTRAIWILVILMLPLAYIFYWTETFTQNLTYLYIPLAAWLGYAFRSAGVRAVAIGAVFLLPPGLSLGQMWIPSEVGLYLVCLAVCQIFAEPDGFFFELNQHRDTRKFYLLAFLLLGVTSSFHPDMFSVDLSLDTFAYGAFFVLGMSNASARRFALALGLAVTVGGLLHAFTLNVIPESDWYWSVRYWLSSPWNFFEGLVFFTCGRLTKNSLRGQTNLRKWTSVAISALAMGTLFTLNFARFELQVVIPDFLSSLQPVNVSYMLFAYSDSFIYVAAFTVALLLGLRGLWTTVIIGAGMLIAMMYTFPLLNDMLNPEWDLYAWNPRWDQSFFDGVITIYFQHPFGLNEMQIILLATSFGLLGNAVRKRFDSIGNGYVLPANKTAIRAAEETAHRTRRLLRRILTSWVAALALMLCCFGALIFFSP